MKKIVLAILLLPLLTFIAHAAQRTETTGSWLIITNHTADTLFHYFSDNTGAVYVGHYLQNNLRLDNLGFEHNNGRGLIIEPGADVAWLQYSDFTHNLKGGLSIHQRSRLEKIFNVSFHSNQAENGAGLYIFDQANPIGQMQEVSFTNNRANGYGGGIFFGNTRQTLNNGTFQNNWAEKGGALYTQQPFSFTAENVLFEVNGAQQGGAVYAGQKFILSGGNILFSQNTSTLEGGAIYAQDNLCIQATSGDIEFRQNGPSAIFMARPESLLTLAPSSLGDIIMDDPITANGLLRLEIRGQGHGRVLLKQSLSNAQINLKQGFLYLNPAANWQDITVKAQGGTLDLSDGQTSPLHIGKIQLEQDLTVQPEVNLATGQIDSLQWDQIEGPGALNVGRFILSGAEALPSQTLPFIPAGSDLEVRVPQVAYNELYAYDTAFNPIDGSVSFSLRTNWNRADSFNPGVLAVAAASYAALSAQLDASAQILLPQSVRFLRYEDRDASFYIQPFYQLGSLSFSNGLDLSGDISGFAAGWNSRDLGWFHSAIVSAAFHFWGQKASWKYTQQALANRSLAAGASLLLESNRFFALAGLFAGQQHQQIPQRQRGQNLLFSQARLLVGYSQDLYEDSIFLQPYFSLAYAWQAAGKETLYREAVLSYPAASLLELKGGVQLIWSQQDRWHWQAGAQVTQRLDTGSRFQANSQQLASFESGLIYELNLGFGTEGSSRWGLSGEIFGRLGGAESVGGRVQLEF